jgi:type IV fimbrial biogenesis protein FimT
MKTSSLQRQSKAGFTLIELMIAIAIAAVLMMVAAPNFVGFQRNSEMTSITNSLIGAINAARSEAMKSGMNAVVAPKNGTAWSSGWIVYVDRNRDNTYASDTDTLVLDQASPPSYLTISGTGSASGATPYIMFNSSGYSKTVGGTSGNLTLSLVRNDVPSARANEQTRRIKIGRSGRSRACKPSTDSTCAADTLE